MYDKKVAEYKTEQNEILSQMQAHSDADHDFYLTANKVFNLAKRAAEIFDSSEPMEKRQLLNFLLQNCTLNGQKLGFTLKEPFNLIVKTRHQPIGLPEWDDYLHIDWANLIPCPELTIKQLHQVLALA
jgi:hypothetical protein